MTTSARLTPGLLALCLVASTRTLAQEPRRLATPDSIPVELATALIASGGLGGEPILLVGSLPEWFTTRIAVPSEARVLGSASLGSTVVRDAILRLQPRLVVCGHIHGSGGQQAMLGATPVVNAGPRGVLFEI